MAICLISTFMGIEPAKADVCDETYRATLDACMNSGPAIMVGGSASTVGVSVDLIAQCQLSAKTARLNCQTNALEAKAFVEDYWSPQQ
jgi:hypothetical protein